MLANPTHPAASQIWSGDLDHLRTIAPSGDLPVSVVSRPRATIDRRTNIATIKISGIVISTSWSDLAAEIASMSSKRSIRGILLHFDSQSQQMAGHQMAIEAIRRAKRQMPVIGHIDACVGIAFAVANQCTNVYISPDGQIGRGEIDTAFIERTS